MPATFARHLIVHGKVQGVFYRNWAVAMARSLQLAGWVRNRADGTVEIVVEGPLKRIQQFITAAHEGPAAALVERIIIDDRESQGLLSFEKQPTI